MSLFYIMFYLRKITMLMVVIFFCSGCSVAKNSLVSLDLPISMAVLELQEKSSSELVGKEVIVYGYLNISAGNGVLYNSLNSLNQLSRKDAVSLYLDDDELLKYKKYSGCFVNVVGYIEKIGRNSDFYQIKNIENIYRSGYFYIASKNKYKKEPKCLSNVIIELMDPNE